MAAMSHAVRREVLRAPSRQALLEGACHVAVELGGLRLAWVGWLEQGTLKAVARAGHDEGYVDAVLPSLLGARAQGPTARSLLNNEPAYTDDFQTDPRMAPWREAAGARGLVSSAALPLRLRGEVVGTLNIYSGEVGVFRGETRTLVEELAEDISYTLDRQEDVADRERAREAWRALFELAAESIFLSDAQGRYLDVNQAGVRLLGYSPEELRKLTFLDVIPAEDLRAAPLQISKVLHREATVHYRRLRAKDGHIIDAEISSTQLPDGRVQGIVRDVTEQYRLMAELAQADRLAAVGRLAASIAHEVNNPLAYVVLNLSLLVRHFEGHGAPIPASPLQLARDAMDGAERVADIVRDLRAMTRVRDEAPAPMDLQAAAETALRIAGHQVRRHAKLVTDFRPCATVHANAPRIEQVIINLLTNAAQAVPAGPPEANTITVRVFEEQGVGVLEVADTGEGIPAEVQPRIFDPFFTTRSTGEGTGLGLAISHNLVTANGGKLTFTSAMDRGTTFRVELPLSKEPPAEKRDTSGEAPRPLTGLAVLVVDDEAGIREAMVRLLPGCTVGLAADVDSALEQLSARKWDVVISDVLMPGATAADLLEAVRSDFPELVSRVVLMTGAAGDEAVRRLRAELTVPVLEKPFDAAALERVVRQLLESDVSD